MGERRSVSGHMLKLEESTGLPDRLELTRIIFNVLAWSTERVWSCHQQINQTMVEEIWRWEKKLGTFEIFIWHQSRISRWTVEYRIQRGGPGWRCYFEHCHQRDGHQIWMTHNNTFHDFLEFNYNLINSHFSVTYLPPGRFRHVWLFATPSTATCQAPLFMEFFRQEYWSELPCPPPGDLPNVGTKLASLASPALQGD